MVHLLFIPLALSKMSMHADFESSKPILMRVSLNSFAFPISKTLGIQHFIILPATSCVLFSIYSANCFGSILLSPYTLLYFYIFSRKVFLSGSSGICTNFTFFCTVVCCSVEFSLASFPLLDFLTPSP